MKINLPAEIKQFIDESISFTIHYVPTRSKTNVVVALFPVENAMYTIIFSHGNATDLGQMFPIFAQMSKILQVNIIGYDYSGYGASTGSPSEAQTYRDIEAVYLWIIQTLSVSPESVILYGQSVGSGPSTYFASRVAVGGLILHSAILSGLRVLTENRGIFACCDIFPNINAITRVRCPVFIIHGEVPSLRKSFAVLNSFIFIRMTLKFP